MKNRRKDFHYSALVFQLYWMRNRCDKMTKVTLKQWVEKGCVPASSLKDRSGNHVTRLQLVMFSSPAPQQSTSHRNWNLREAWWILQSWHVSKLIQDERKLQERWLHGESRVRPSPSNTGGLWFWMSDEEETFTSAPRWMWGSQNNEVWTPLLSDPDAPMLLYFGVVTSGAAALHFDACFCKQNKSVLLLLKQGIFQRKTSTLQRLAFECWNRTKAIVHIPGVCVGGGLCSLILFDLQ